MKVISEYIKLSSPGYKPTFHAITEQVKDIVKNSGVTAGICVVFSKHTTCSVMIEEDSIDEAYSGKTYLQQDLTDVLEELIPTCRRETQYMHPGPLATEFAATHGEDKPGTLNTDGHLRSSIIGRSESIPIIDGKLELGDFGHIYFIDMDQTRPRERKVVIQIVGV